jgi:hypothetical protein
MNNDDDDYYYYYLLSDYYYYNFNNFLTLRQNKTTYKLRYGCNCNPTLLLLRCFFRGIFRIAQPPLFLILRGKLFQIG